MYEELIYLKILSMVKPFIKKQGIIMLAVMSSQDVSRTIQVFMQRQNCRSVEPKIKTIFKNLHNY